MSERWSTSLANLPGYRDGFSNGKLAEPPDGAFQVLSGHILHGDEVRPLLLHELVHPADVSMANPPSRLELILKPFQGLALQGDLRPDELEGPFLIDLPGERSINPAH